MPAEQVSVAAIERRNVHRTFGPVRAVDGIDLELELGEIAALLGPNGAGKTTTIDIILGLGRPDRGSVSVLGMSPSAAVSQVIGPVLGSVPCSVACSSRSVCCPRSCRTSPPSCRRMASPRSPAIRWWGGAFDPTWLLSVVLWTAAFAAAAMIHFRRDTRRT